MSEKWTMGMKALGLGSGTIGGAWSWLAGSLGAAFPVLLVMMLFDYITGLMVGATTGTLNSAVGRKGFIRKLYVLILIGAVYLIERILFQTQHIGDGVTIAYIIIEFISITENGGKLGAPIPQPVKNLIAVLKEKGNGKG